jgi:arsenite methyltransferase
VVFPGGVDSSAEMLAKATDNATKGNYTNVVFEQGEMARLPLDDECVAVVISTCVLNYAEDLPHHSVVCAAT